MRRKVGSITSYPVQPVRTSFTKLTGYGLMTRSIVATVTITVSMSAKIAAGITGTGMVMIAQMMRMRRVATLSIVTRTDLAHTSLAWVSIISALS